VFFLIFSKLMLAYYLKIFILCLSNDAFSKEFTPSRRMKICVPVEGSGHGLI
jgi:hypothetical protein